VKEHCRKKIIMQVARENCWAYASAMIETQGGRALQGARDRELVDHYKWKVAWLRMDGMHAVRVFKAVIKIQKVARGMIARKKHSASQEDGIGAIEMAVKNAVTVGMLGLSEKLGLPGGGGASANAELLMRISKQLNDLSGRLEKIEHSKAGKSAGPPALPK